MRIAVIVAVYNRPDALAALLEGYRDQDNTGFEVIVADDGSTREVRDLVRAWASRSPFPLSHLWHEDRGFRASTIRNRALAATRADYVIFTDGDCIPSRQFVSRHRRLAERGYFLSGSRILLSEDLTARVLQRHIPVQSWGPMQWLAARLSGDVNQWLPSLALPDGGFRKRDERRWRGVKTCNLSAWRADLLSVNGFDETYAGKWGMEDTNLVLRLLHAGIRHKSARFAAPVFHLWHPENDKSGLPENQRLIAELLAAPRARAPLGVDQYL